ncbi:MAG: hypothetical protein ACI8ZF_000941 [Candidatus Midichloriaceae bacterium]|jgi:hypothetical protein
MKLKSKWKNTFIISVLAILVLFGAIYGTKLISRHNINPYNVKYSAGKYIDGVLPSRENSILMTNISDVIENEKLNELKILDFGSGDGRHFFIIKKLSDIYPEINIRYLAYDISEVGLRNFQNTLVAEGFQSHENKIFINSSEVAEFKAYKAVDLKKGNITVTILHASVNSVGQDITDILGENINVIFSMYGSFMHIPYYKNRVHMLKTLALSLDKKGKIILDAPSLGGLKTSQKKYNKLRSNKDFKKLGDAVEDGDIKIEGDQIYYHITTFDELRRLANDSGLIIKEQGITSLKSPKTFNKKINGSDEIYASLMSSLLSIGLVPDDYIERNTAYIYCILELDK